MTFKKSLPFCIALLFAEEAICAQFRRDRFCQRFRVLWRWLFLEWKIRNSSFIILSSTIKSANSRVRNWLGRYTEDQNIWSDFVFLCWNGRSFHCKTFAASIKDSSRSKVKIKWSFEKHLAENEKVPFSMWEDHCIILYGTTAYFFSENHHHTARRRVFQKPFRRQEVS